MQHLLTLETQSLSPAARAVLGEAAAIAYFVSSVNDHDGLSSGNWAVVPLSTEQLSTATAAQGSSEVPGRRLRVEEVSLPTAVFRGGVKSGALLELRRALDDLGRAGASFCDESSVAQWVQGPENIGPLVLELDERFLLEFNFADGGRLYLTTDAVVFQSG